MSQAEFKNIEALLRLIDEVTIGNQGILEEIPLADEEYSLLERKVFQMLRVIVEREKLLEEQSSNLVKLVNQRTKELEVQKIINIQNSKMSALGEMAGGIAHEINTPLATMKMLVGSTSREIDKEIFDVEFVTDKLQKINVTIDRIAKIVKGLKSFSRDGSKDPFVDTSVKSVIEDTIFLCKEKFVHRSVDLRISYENDQLSCECRATQISQVILNLLSNSLDAIENEKDKWIEIKQYSDDLSIFLSITDSGHGIPKQIKQKIFDPFFTTKGVEKGTGLGLSISLGIVKDHQGEMSINDDCPNTQFVIKLPKKRL